MTATTVADAPPRALDFPRILTEGTTSYRDHLAVTGGRTSVGPLVDEVARSGLTGRGGAAFPAARKLAATAPRGVVVGNGSEGEPLSSKDEVLLRHRPHLVIDGLLATARAVRARETHLVVGPAMQRSVEDALAERGDAREVRVTVTRDGFVGGEASAVVRLLSSGEALPTDHAVRLTAKGLRGRPTLVQNVETLAHIGLIDRYGGDWFRTAGAPDDPGTRLLTISGDVERSGVTEAAGGATLRSVLGRARPRGLSGVLIGGYHGTWYGPEALDHRLGAVAGPATAAAGAGIVMVLGEGRCGVAMTAEIATWLAGESAGQCGPCINGLPALAQQLRRLARCERDPRILDRVRHLAGLVVGRGACHHPDGTVRMIASALEVFADEARAHQRGQCCAVR